LIKNPSYLIVFKLYVIKTICYKDSCQSAKPIDQSNQDKQWEV